MLGRSELIPENPADWSNLKKDVARLAVFWIQAADECGGVVANTTRARFDELRGELVEVRGRLWGLLWEQQRATAAVVSSSGQQQ
jgi:hypothetical protein